MFTDFILKGIGYYKNHPILLGLFDSIALVALDVSAEILSVHKQYWVWKSGEYFGIPLKNYLGWFIITFISFTIFRLFEVHNPSKNKIFDQLLDNLVSSLYMLFNLVCIGFLYLIGLNLGVMISLVATMPFILLWMFVILKKININMRSD
jgi:putative membrane protein